MVEWHKPITPTRNTRDTQKISYERLQNYSTKASHAKQSDKKQQTIHVPGVCSGCKPGTLVVTFPAFLIVAERVTVVFVKILEAKRKQYF